MAELELLLKYDGPELESGRISVRELAPALLALGEVFHEINAIANPGGEDIGLDIRATERGSFGVNLILGNPQLVTEAVRLMASDGAVALANCVAIFGALIALSRRLRGRPISDIDRSGLDPGQTRVTLDDGDSIEVQSEVAELYQSHSLRRNLAGAVRPLARDGIERMELTAPEQEPVVINKQDSESILAIPPTATADRDSSIRSTLVKIVTPSLEGSYKWRFSEGGPPFTATINDEDFLERVRAGVEVFRNGDFLQVLLRTTQTITEEGGLRVRYGVDRVEAHVAAIEVVAESFPQLGNRDE